MTDDRDEKERLHDEWRLRRVRGESHPWHWETGESQLRIAQYDETTDNRDQETFLKRRNNA
jgi:hypothetical protein